jgi:hypothetical protein
LASNNWKSRRPLWLRGEIEGAMVEKRGDQIVETAQEARQAERGPTVRNVLVISTTAVIIAFVAIWLMFFSA